MADQLGGGHLEGGARPCRGDATALEHGHLVGLGLGSGSGLGF